MARRTKSQLVECLTEEQREGIRRGWKMPGTYFPGEKEREHAFAIEERARKAGVEVNERRILLEVPQRAPTVEEPQLTGGQPLED